MQATNVELKKLTAGESISGYAFVDRFSWILLVMFSVVGLGLVIRQRYKTAKAFNSIKQKHNI